MWEAILGRQSQLTKYYGRAPLRGEGHRTSHPSRNDRVLHSKRPTTWVKGYPKRYLGRLLVYVSSKFGSSCSGIECLPVHAVRSLPPNARHVQNSRRETHHVPHLPLHHDIFRFACWFFTHFNQGNHDGVPLHAARHGVMDQTWCNSRFGPASRQAYGVCFFSRPRGSPGDLQIFLFDGVRLAIESLGRHW